MKALIQYEPSSEFFLPNWRVIVVKEKDEPNLPYRFESYTFTRCGAILSAKFLLWRAKRAIRIAASRDTRYFEVR